MHCCPSSTPLLLLLLLLKLLLFEGAMISKYNSEPSAAVAFKMS
jgi:hypothetical protein